MTQPPFAPRDEFVPQYQSAATGNQKKVVVLVAVIVGLAFICGCGGLGFLWMFSVGRPMVVIPLAPRTAPPASTAPAALPGPASFSPTGFPANFPPDFPTFSALRPTVVIPDSKDPRGGLITLAASSTISHNAIARWFDDATAAAGWSETGSRFHDDQIERDYAKNGIVMHLAISPGHGTGPASVVMIYSGQ